MCQTIKKCHNIVTFFHRSATAEECLKRPQEKEFPNSTPLQLIGDVETRWNSQYMLHPLLQIKHALSSVLCEPRMPDNLSSYEWCLIKHYCDTLKILKEATLIMSEESSPTLCRYVPIVYGIQKTLTDIIHQTFEIDNSLPHHLLNGLINRFQFVHSNDLLTLSMISDPRVKDKLLDENTRINARKLLEDTVLKYSDTTSTASQRSSIPSMEIPYKTDAPFLFEFLNTISCEETAETSDVSAITECHKYFQTKLEPSKTCILSWWKGNKNIFPQLSAIARNILGVPGTQVYSERLFSTAGNVVTVMRTSLLCERVEKICFLCANMKI
ncbi:E3 SUMO-protein ligase ZBED1-like [Hylaeus anthracinus]|uniref:E3 SUMO-protein ligase ZBED1-like n=1 Tax=Hylaeus anthracinus TaxID=313031 RepID=UPI0023B8DF6D|nr:E3 SUMO-protein ligase ZBED1-like [Hylaeus anthracinus]